MYENLRAGRVRLVFVADLIPDELRRIVEFLNTQMTPAEVFAVEVKQYTAPGFDGRTIVPSVVGRTAAASLKQASRSSVDPDAVRAAATDSTRACANKLEQWATEHGALLSQKSASTQLRRPDGTVICHLYFKAGTLDVDLGDLRRQDPNQAEQVWGQLQSTTAKKLTQTYPSVPTADVVTHWPQVDSVLAVLANR